MTDKHRVVIAHVLWVPMVAFLGMSTIPLPGATGRWVDTASAWVWMGAIVASLAGTVIGHLIAVRPDLRSAHERAAAAGQAAVAIALLAALVAASARVPLTASLAITLMMSRTVCRDRGDGHDNQGVIAPRCYVRAAPRGLATAGT